MGPGCGGRKALLSVEALLAFVGMKGDEEVEEGSEAREAVTMLLLRTGAIFF